MQLQALYQFRSALAAEHFYDAIQLRLSTNGAFRAELYKKYSSVRVYLSTTDLALVSMFVKWLEEYFAEVGGVDSYPQFDQTC